MSENLNRAEEAKRERAWQPAERWRALQAAIAWAEAQPGVRRNTPQACHRAERRKLASAGNA